MVWAQAQAARRALAGEETALEPREEAHLKVDGTHPHGPRVGLGAHQGRLARGCRHIRQVLVPGHPVEIGTIAGLPGTARVKEVPVQVAPDARKKRGPLCCFDIRVALAATQAFSRALKVPPPFFPELGFNVIFLQL